QAARPRSPGGSSPEPAILMSTLTALLRNDLPQRQPRLFGDPRSAQVPPPQLTVSEPEQAPIEPSLAPGNEPVDQPLLKIDRPHGRHVKRRHHWPIGILGFVSLLPFGMLHRRLPLARGASAHPRLPTDCWSAKSGCVALTI